MIALINSLAVVGFYLAVRRFYGQFVGATAGLLMAFSPWMIVMSRKIWAPDMVLPLAVLWFYFLHQLILDKKPKAILGIIVTLGLLTQLHTSGLFLVLPSAIAIIATRVKINWKYVLIGLALSIVPILPYVAFQLQNGCPDCQAFFTYQKGEALTAIPFFDTNAFLRPFQFINGSGFQNVLGEDGYRDFLDQYPWLGLFNIIFLLEFGLFVLGLVFLIPRSRIVLAILIGVPLLIFISRTPAHLYYFLIVSPISILAYALGTVPLGKLLHLEGVRAHLPGVIVIATIISVNIIFMLMFYQFLDKRGQIQGDYGSIYRVTEQKAVEKGMNVEEYVIEE